MKKLTDEKISEEMKNKLIAAAKLKDVDGQIIVDRWRAAGLLEPEEDALEKARVAWEKRKAVVITADGQITSNVACEYIKQLLAEVKRLKDGAWTDEDMRVAWLTAFSTENCGDGILCTADFDKWLSVRKKRKDGE